MLNNIEAERARNRMSKEELAKALNVSDRSYYNWVYEKTDIPSSVLIKMSELFGVETSYLLEGSIHSKKAG